MVRPRKLFPSRYWHKRARQWVVKIDGKTVYLGAEEAAAEATYRELAAEHLSRQVKPPPRITPSRITVAEVLLRYLDEGVASLDHRQQHRIQTAVDAAVNVCVGLQASRFDQLQLDRVRRHLLMQPSKRGALRLRLFDLLARGPCAAGETERQLQQEGFSLAGIRLARRALAVVAQRQGRTVILSLPPGAQRPVPPRLSRHYVNSLIDCLRTAWSWAVFQQLVPAGSDLALRSLKSLRKGQGGREVADVLPVADAIVDATLPYLPPPVQAMVELSRLSGMRPGEVCRLCPCEVSCAPEQPIALRYGETRREVAAVKIGSITVWLYAPQAHKTEHRGKARLVALGPRAQTILAPYLQRDPQAYCFSPREAADSWRDEHGRARRYGKGRQPGDHYTTDSYDQAIERAAQRAGVPHWTANQLRHGAATTVSAAFDPATAAALLGHSTPDVTYTYILDQLQKAATAAAQLG